MEVALGIFAGLVVGTVISFLAVMAVVGKAVEQVLREAGFQRRLNPKVFDVLLPK